MKKLLASLCFALFIAIGVQPAKAIVWGVQFDQTTQVAKELPQTLIYKDPNSPLVIRLTKLSCENKTVKEAFPVVFLGTEGLPIYAGNGVRNDGVAMDFCWVFHISEDFPPHIDILDETGAGGSVDPSIFTPEKTI